MRNKIATAEPGESSRAGKKRKRKKKREKKLISIVATSFVPAEFVTTRNSNLVAMSPARFSKSFVSARWCGGLLSEAARSLLIRASIKEATAFLHGCLESDDWPRTTKRALAAETTDTPGYYYYASQIVILHATRCDVQFEILHSRKFCSELLSRVYFKTYHTSYVWKKNL